VQTGERQKQTLRAGGVVGMHTGGTAQRQHKIRGRGGGNEAEKTGGGKGGKDVTGGSRKQIRQEKRKSTTTTGVGKGGEKRG